MKKILWLIVVLAPSLSAADMTGHFSRANCVNNESITFTPLRTQFPAAVISWHTPDWGLLHYAGHEDPNVCALQPCPTNPNPLEDATCYTHDFCGWPMTTNWSGRWAAIHNVSLSDQNNGFQTGPWTVEGRHVVYTGPLFGNPTAVVIESGPETDCNL